MCTPLLCRRVAFNWFREVWRGLEDTGRNERAMDKWWKWRRGGGEGELSREAVVCVLYEGMEGVNPFLHHYLVSASALTLISLRAARLARTLPHHSIHPSTPFKTLRHHPSSRLIPFTSMSFFLCSLYFLQRFPHFLCLSCVVLHLCLCGNWLKYQTPNPTISTAVHLHTHATQRA